jgi:glycosyltransferase involved in cell wall biosynthesis
LAGPFDSPEDEERFTGLVREEGVCDFVKFLGPIKGQAKTEAFRDADIFILPSYAEGVPISMLEAMSYGIPVVVTDVGGIPETVTDGQEGFIVRPGQIEAIAAALSRLVGEPELRRQMGRAGRARIERSHSVKVYFDALRRLYGELSISPGGSRTSRPERA